MNIYNNSIYNHPQIYQPLVVSVPSSSLEMVVVIPCYKEPELINTLNSLISCELPKCVVEILIILNSADNADDEVIEINNSTKEQFKNWHAQYNSLPLGGDAEGGMSFHLIEQNNLPKKHAGVGLARKIGMDEAWYRFLQIDNFDGIIVNLDADCTVEPNYLTEIFEDFQKNSKTPGVSIHFEHPLEGDLDKKVYEGIINYELHLRYYINALRFAEIPHAFHTVGSSMAVRANVYAKQGGMNRRKAGEDFYFLHKVIPLGNYSEIVTTKVIPSPRESDRVPFGTGKAISQWMISDKEVYTTYSLQSFVDLKFCSDNIAALYDLTKDNNIEQWLNKLPESLKTYFQQNRLEEVIEEILINVTSEKAFIKRFYRWFDGLKVLQFIHFCRDNYYKNEPVAQVSTKMLQELDDRDNTNLGLRELLDRFREIDRQGEATSKDQFCHSER
ncbi:MAG: glycosyltransferase [Bacteroidia bacterium]|nr:glycosyltransferase [Bacteroidia bacterium]